MSDHETHKPTDATTYLGTHEKNLHPWDVGPAVVQLQELLRAQGFRLSVTGEFNSHTEDAVLIFQRRHNLRMDAIVGPKTWAALKTVVKPGSRILRIGTSGADVRELQGLLQVNGYMLQRDGVFGPETKLAVMDFQERHKLRTNGQVDRIMWWLLQNGYA